MSRVRKIIKAGKVVQDKLNLSGWARVPVLAVVAIISEAVSDPDIPERSRHFPSAVV